MLDAEDDVPSLSISAEKVLPRPIHAELIAYEPWTDLIATVSGDQDVDIYRFGGQRVMTKKSNRKNSRVTALAWDHKGLNPSSLTYCRTAELKHSRKVSGYWLQRWYCRAVRCPDWSDK